MSMPLRVSPAVARILALPPGRDGRLDGQGFEEFARKHIDELRSYALSFTISNYHIAEDAVQETMIAVFASWPDILWAASAENYLKKMVKNKVIDLYRRDGRFLPLPAVDDLLIVDRGADPSNSVVDQELQKEVHQMIDRLPPKQRMVFSLYIEGTPMTEVSDHLGISLHTARVHLMRARAALRKALAQGETVSADVPGRKGKSRQAADAA